MSLETIKLSPEDTQEFRKPVILALELSRPELELVARHDMLTATYPGIFDEEVQRVYAELVSAMDERDS